MRLTLVMLFLAIVVGSATAQVERGVMMGPGAGSCAEFAKEYREAPQRTETLYYVWAQGFMSGLNLAYFSEKRLYRDLNGWQISDQLVALRMFCDQRPLALFVEATKSLFDKLPKIVRQSK